MVPQRGERSQLGGRPADQFESLEAERHICGVSLLCRQAHAEDLKTRVEQAGMEAKLRQLALVVVGKPDFACGPSRAGMHLGQASEAWAEAKFGGCGVAVILRSLVGSLFAVGGNIE